MSQKNEMDLSRRNFLGTSAKTVAVAAAALAGALSPLSAHAAEDNSMKTLTARTPAGNKTITVGQGPYAGNTNVALQKAVDEVAAAGGGVVRIPAGTYTMHDALHLRTGVHVIGEKGTILVKQPSVSSALRGYMGYGHADFLPAEPEKFQVGMGVIVTDKNAGGFMDTVGTIIARQGEFFVLDMPAWKDYDGAIEGKITSLFPLVEATRVSDAGIENIEIDGSAEPLELNSCRGGGIYMFQARRMLVKNVEVRNFKGDGISYQQCIDIFVRSCHVHHCTGMGLHPGSGTVRYVIDGNNVHHNGNCGLFFCLRTTHSIVTNNRFDSNAAYGIQVNERDSDHWIENNTITNNKLAGMGFNIWSLRTGDRIVIKSNRFAGNCAGGQAEADLWLRRPVRDIYIVDNTFQQCSRKPIAVYYEGCSDIYCDGNTLAGKPIAADDVAGARNVNFKRPQALPAIRPADLPADGALHLGIKQLPPYIERL